MSSSKLKLFSLKLGSGNDFRFVILNPLEDSADILLLFLGVDVLTSAQVLNSNHSRIHVRYAKKGFATKLHIPIDLHVEGIPNATTSGTWFYSLQGVLKLVFEYGSRTLQVSAMSKLGDLWQLGIGHPALPSEIHVNPQLLLNGLSSLEGEDAFRHLQEEYYYDKQFASSTSDDSKDIPVFTHVYENVASTTTPEWESEKSESWSLLLRNLIRQTSNVHSRCDSQHKVLASGLQSFLRFLKLETDKPAIDDSATMLLHLLNNYTAIVSDPASLKSFRNAWGISDKANALLCLVAECMGKRMFTFTDKIAQKVDDFKENHIENINKLPPPQTLIENLFPMFMKLLIGHWIGLYKSGGDSEETVEVVAVPKKTQPHAESRDHSYFSHKEATTGATAEEITSSGSSPRTNNRDDHSYFNPEEPGNSVSAAAEEVVAAEDRQGAITVKPAGREDHSYSTSVTSLATGSSGEEPVSSRNRSKTKDASRRKFEEPVVSTRKRTRLAQQEEVTSKKHKQGDGLEVEKKGKKDHTYSSTTSGTSCEIPTSQKDKDHTYVSHSPDSTASDAPLPDDHTYGASLEEGAHSSKMDKTDKKRKDHTYFVSNHPSKRNKSAPITGTGSKAVPTSGTGSKAVPSSGTGSNMQGNRSSQSDSTSLPSKRPKPTSSGTKSAVLPSVSRMEVAPNYAESGLDPSKYPFVQLVLEFMNNTLISGLSHVVYTKLLRL